MEPAGKVIGALKGLPLSMLAGLAVVAVATWAYAPLQAAVPADMRTYLPFLSVLLSVLTAFAAVAQAFSAVQARSIDRKADAGQRLAEVYGPLVALFVRRHVTSCSGVLAPRIKHRLENAKAELFRYRRPLVGLRRAFRALGDRQVSTSAEVEYGGEFPMAEIHIILSTHTTAAGPTLLNLVRRADRSRYEDEPIRGLLTDEEYALFQYIHDQHDRLSRAANVAATSR